MQFLLAPVCLAVLCAVSPVLQAKPRVMADAEMDEVCAKGSTGFNVDSAALNQMVFAFSQATSLGQVSGSGAVTVEVIPNASGQSQFLIGTPTTAGATLATDLRVVNGTVQVTGNLNINMQALPSVVNALQQNRLVLPPGFNPLGLGVGGLR